MRYISLKLIAALFLTFSLTSCTDVGVNPKGQQAGDVIFQEPENYENYLAKLYGGLVLTGQAGEFGNDDIGLFEDEGKGGYSRQLWNLQTLPTEEAINSWTNDPEVPPYNSHTWDQENPLLDAMFSRIYFQIANANLFLERAGNAEVSGDLAEDIQKWRAEARFLRALSYWHGLDLFREIPFTEKVGGTPPEQVGPERIFDFIESELQDITGDGSGTLPEPGQAEYGRADKGAAWTLLTKLYLNAEVYLGEGETHYDEAVSAAEKVIESGAYDLEVNRPYGDLFRADNHTHSGIIFALPQDGDQTRTYSNTTFLMHATSGGFMEPGTNLKELRGITGSWLGYRTTPSLVDQFEGGLDTTEVACRDVDVIINNVDSCPDPEEDDVSEEEFEMATRDSSFWNVENGDHRAIFFTDGQQGEVKTLGPPGETFQNGFAVIKYKNITSNGDLGKNATFPDTDFPMFRLADVYLMYAEAVLRGGDGNQADALGYINDIRERAYPDSDGSVSSIDLEFILDERARELYHEAHRRTDLVRYEVVGGHPDLGFSTKGTWAWKGSNENPEGQTTPACKNVYPIPQTQINANPNLSQNEQNKGGCN